MNKQIEEMVNVMIASNNPFVDVPIEIMPKVAKALYNAGYRKVLIDTENGKTVDCAQYAPWQLMEGYMEREVEKVRKDTAKAILNVLYFNLQNSVKGNLAKSNDYYNVIGRIQEIAKNYGVEIEE